MKTTIQYHHELRTRQTGVIPSEIDARGRILTTPVSETTEQDGYAETSYSGARIGALHESMAAANIGRMSRIQSQQEKHKAAMARNFAALGSRLVERPSLDADDMRAKLNAPKVSSFKPKPRQGNR